MSVDIVFHSILLSHHTSSPPRPLRHPIPIVHPSILLLSGPPSSPSPIASHLLPTASSRLDPTSTALAP